MASSSALKDGHVDCSGECCDWLDMVGEELTASRTAVLVGSEGAIERAATAASAKCIS